MTQQQHTVQVPANVGQTITFGVDLFTTWWKTLAGMVDDRTPLNVALSLWNDDFTAVGPARELVLVRVLDQRKFTGLALADLKGLDEAYALVFPMDKDTGEAVKGAMPEWLPTSRVAHVHVQ